MRELWKTWLALAVVCSLLLVVFAGCPDGSDQVDLGPPDDETNGAADPADPPEPEPKVPEAVEPAPEAVPTEIPPVQMTDAERALCLVDVGDSMPDAQLPDLEGVDRSLSSLLGSKATVVLFWTASGSPIAAATAQAVLDDLQVDVVEQYADRGVHVVSINENDTSEKVVELRDLSAAEFPMLLDPQGAYFQTVAEERLPRLYVLDADGRILWLDFGYSETTRDTLQSVLRYLAAE